MLTVPAASSQETEDGSAAASSAPAPKDAAEVSQGQGDSQEHQENSPPAGRDAQQMVCCVQYNLFLDLILVLFLRRKRNKQRRCHQDPFKARLCLEF